MILREWRWRLTCSCCMLEKRRLAVPVGGKAFSPSVSIPSFWPYIYVPPSQRRPPKICSGTSGQREKRSSSSSLTMDSIIRVHPWEQHLITWWWPLTSFRFNPGRTQTRKEWMKGMMHNQLFSLSFYFMMDRSMPAPIRLLLASRFVNVLHQSFWRRAYAGVKLTWSC